MQSTNACRIDGMTQICHVAISWMKLTHRRAPPLIVSTAFCLSLLAPRDIYRDITEVTLALEESTYNVGIAWLHADNLWFQWVFELFDNAIWVILYRIYQISAAKIGLEEEVAYHVGEIWNSMVRLANHVHWTPTNQGGSQNDKSGQRFSMCVNQSVSGSHRRWQSNDTTAEEVSRGCHAWAKQLFGKQICDYLLQLTSSTMSPGVSGFAFLVSPR